MADEKSDNPAAGEVVWALPETVTLSWRSWQPDEIIVFNAASGQTHLLDAFSAEVLRDVERGPATVERMSADLAAELGEPEDVIGPRLVQTLTAFDKLGLAGPRPRQR